MLISSKLFALSLSEKKEEERNFLADEQNTTSIFQNSVNSVVNVTNIKLAKSWVNWGEYETVEIPAGAGTGFVWDTNGHIVTNSHVVEGGNSFIITFHKDKKQYAAKAVGVAKDKDIAVLKISELPETLTPIKVSTSKNLMVGQKAVAIGNPFGLDHTMTAGIVSALDRKIQGFGGVSIEGMIQTDASINPGNSGGPLLDSSGKLIGMNTMIFSQSGSSAGVGFAVPVDTIKRVVPELILHGKIIRPGLGIGVLTEQQRERLGIVKGIVITYMDPKGSAAKSGLQGMNKDAFGRIHLGDIILKINEKEVNSRDDLYLELDKYKIGETVDITYLRDEKIKTTKVKLQKI
jgi:S1-C subfamily serine protease